MNYQGFKDYIVKHVKNYLPEKYQDANVEITAVRKNNNLKLDGLSIRLPEENVCPNIYMNSFYEEFKTGRSMEEILEKIAEIRDIHDVQKNLSVEDFLDFEKMEDNIIFRVVGAKENESRLSDMPHRLENDMAIVYQIMAEKAGDGVATVQITNHMMERLGVDERKLYEVALKNTQREFPATFRPMSEVIKEIMRSDFMGINLNTLSDDDDMKPFLEALFQEGMEDMQEERLPLFVLSNDRGINGAAALFYPDMKEQIAKQMNGDYFVLPSSIHEVLIVPDNGDADYKELKDMVNEVNQTQVAPDEVLTGEVYSYDRDSRRLMFAGEKAEKVHGTEKAEDKKASIIDTLKAKKNEVVHSSVDNKMNKMKTAEREI